MRILIQRCFSEDEESGHVTVVDQNCNAVVLDDSHGIEFVDLGSGNAGIVTITIDPVTAPDTQTP